MTTVRLGVILAGGLARRMNGDKAGALLDGSTLLDRAVATVRAAGLEPKVCARADTILPPARADVWRELPGSDAHPLAGLAHAVHHAGEPIVVLPVDLPLLPPSVLAALAVQQMPLAVIGVGGRAAALVARLDPSYAPALADAATAGAPALRTLVALGAAVIEITDLAPGVDPVRAMTNVNGPDDLEALARLAR